MTNRNSRAFLLLNIAALSAFGPFVTDFYLPALPSMESSFNTTTALVQLSLTCSFVGLAFGQLLMGPLSDKYGRKPILLISLLIFIASTIGCLASKNIESFIFFRLIQGIAGSGGVVVARSIVADLFSGEELAKFFALLGAIHGLAPICAPILGGVMLKYSDWHGVFAILLGLGIILFAINLFFKESLARERRIRGGIMESFTFLSVMKNRQFMRCVFVQAFAMGVMFSFISASSFIFQKHYEVEKLTYSFLFAGAALGITLGASLTPLFRDEKRALKVGIIGLGIMGVVICALLNFKPHFLILEAGFVLTLIFLGFVMPTSTALAMELERDNAGNASAVLGFSVFLVGGIVSPITGLGSDIFISTSMVIFACVVCAVIFGVRTVRAH